MRRIKRTDYNRTMSNRQHFVHLLIEPCLKLTSQHHRLRFVLDIEMFATMMYRRDECSNLETRNSSSRKRLRLRLITLASTDKTLSIIRKLTTKCGTNHWCYNFAFLWKESRKHGNTMVKVKSNDDCLRYLRKRRCRAWLLRRKSIRPVSR
jgi:hypothetical protein